MLVLPLPTNPTPPYVQPDLSDSSLTGRVIPGVSVQAITPCASLTAGSELYVAGATHSTPAITGGGFQLVAQVGAPAPGGGAKTLPPIQLPTPLAPTLIDSWAAVTE
jgi:hypothetical protein